MIRERDNLPKITRKWPAPPEPLHDFDTEWYYGWIAMAVIVVIALPILNLLIR